MTERVNLADNFTVWIDGPANLFKAWAFFKSIPDGEFIPRSFSSVALSLEPDTDVYKILMKGEPQYRLASYTEESGELELILSHPHGVLAVMSNHGHLSINIAHSDIKAHVQADKLRELFQPYLLKNKEKDGVWADFTHMTPNGPTRTRQFLKCPEWEGIEENYDPKTARGIQELMKIESPWEHGRLVIWSGEPGTGKTYALRSLMMAWRKKFEFVIVTDPEKLTADPGYYFGVAGDSTEHPARYPGRRPGTMRTRLSLKDDDEEETPPRRVLFIMEDAADLIMPESRQNHFDKIGKLLNLTDGLFGQGREDLFLVTFNEKVEEIDQAFLRPGRCIARTEFLKIVGPNAQAWLKKRKVPLTCLPQDMTIAELYGKLYGTFQDTEPIQKGFGK